MRLLIIACLTLATAMPAAAETAKERAERCAAQAAIVGQAVEMRTKRKSEDKVKETILETIDPRYVPSVPMLVGYVYTLHRKDLKLDVQASFEAQCNAYKP